MKTVKFELSSSVKYANGSGDEVEANFIELKEPTGKVSNIVCEIESLIQSGALKMAEYIGEEAIAEGKEIAKEKANKKKKGSEIEDEPLDRDSVLSLMFSGSVDMNKVTLHFRELFKSVAYLGGEKLLTTPRMDEMLHHDFRNMMGEYAANFILKS